MSVFRERIQEVTDDVGMLNLARLPLVHNLQEAVYFHHYVQEHLGLLGHHPMQYWSKQLEHVEQLGLVLHRSPEPRLQPPARGEETGFRTLVKQASTDCGRKRRMPIFPCSQKACIRESKQLATFPVVRERATVASGDSPSTTATTESYSTDWKDSCTERRGLQPHLLASSGSLTGREMKSRARALMRASTSSSRLADSAML